MLSRLFSLQFGRTLRKLKEVQFYSLSFIAVGKRKRNAEVRKSAEVNLSKGYFKAVYYSTHAGLLYSKEPADLYNIHPPISLFVSRFVYWSLFSNKKYVTDTHVQLSIIIPNEIHRNTMYKFRIIKNINFNKQNENGQWTIKKTAMECDCNNDLWGS
jgi:hypothetical protein